MKHVDMLIRSRRSVRTFDEKALNPEHLEKLCEWMAKVENPYGLPVEFKLLNSKEQNLNCPVVVGTDLYVGAKMKKAPHLNEAVGYSFEKLILYAQSLGIGTVWVGGTMDRAAFERAMELGADEVMPCVSLLGYPAKKMSVRETLMRKGISADARQPFEKLFFKDSFETPLTQESAGRLAQPLEMVRLGPSAVNKQPWRAVVTDHAVHFYLKRAKGFGGSTLDMQKIDLGIALCHFALSAEENGLSIRFVQDDPRIQTESGVEYIASYEFVH